MALMGVLFCLLCANYLQKENQAGLDVPPVCHCCFFFRACAQRGDKRTSCKQRPHE